MTKDTTNGPITIIINGKNETNATVEGTNNTTQAPPTGKSTLFDKLKDAVSNLLKP
jgi:hypothetical protein